MFDKLDDLLIRFEEIMSELQEPDVANDQKNKQDCSTASTSDKKRNGGHHKSHYE